MISDRKFITVKAASCCKVRAVKVVDSLQLLGHCLLMKTGSLLHNNTYKPERESTSYELCVMCDVRVWCTGSTTIR